MARDKWNDKEERGRGEDSGGHASSGRRKTKEWRRGRERGTRRTPQETGDSLGEHYVNEAFKEEVDGWVEREEVK